MAAEKKLRETCGGFGRDKAIDALMTTGDSELTATAILAHNGYLQRNNIDEGHRVVEKVWRNFAITSAWSQNDIYCYVLRLKRNQRQILEYHRELDSHRKLSWVDQDYRHVIQIIEDME